MKHMRNAMLLLVAVAGSICGVAVAAEAALTAVPGNLLTGKSDGGEAVQIVGARNGSVSGTVIVSGAEARVAGAATALKMGSATIPASAVRVRYAAPWGGTTGRGRGYPPGRDVLLEAPPETTGEAALWVTVDIPAAAKAGQYGGTVTVTSGQAKVVVPLKVTVCDWALPATQAYQTFVGMVQSPDTLALEYKVPLWSDRHWQLVADSLKLIGQAGNRVVYVPLICYTNNGNAESMVRWIDKGQGKFEYDFTVMDRYLDLVQKHMGEPRVVVFQVWEIYQEPAQNRWNDDWWAKLSDAQKKNSYFRGLKERADLRRKLQKEKGLGPAVTVLDPKTGETANLYMAAQSSPEGKAQWKPLMDQIRERMRKRKLEQAMMLGMVNDVAPSKAEVAMFHEVSGGLPWVAHGHQGHFHHDNDKKLHGIAEVGYAATVFNIQFVLNPAKERLYGWQRPATVVEYQRFGFMNGMPLATIRHMAEYNITGNQHGQGRIGADMWPAIADKQGRRVGIVYERYAQCLWRNLDIRSWMLAPGPDGPVGTARLEMFREGVQECEARIAIEKVLTNPAARKRLGADLAKRAQAILDERHRAMWKARGGTDSAIEIHGKLVGIRAWIPVYHKKWDEKRGNAWFAGSNWQNRTKALFDVAGEVARAQ